MQKIRAEQWPKVFRISASGGTGAHSGATVTAFNRVPFDYPEAKTPGPAIMIQISKSTNSNYYQSCGRASSKK